MQKKQRGARFSTVEEFQAGLSTGSIADMHFDGCGIPLISTKDKLWVDDSEAHTIGIGSTGAGKSTLGAIPAIYSMLARGESCIVTDLKGEIFRNTSGAAEKAGYKVIVINFDRPTCSNQWNPLSLPNEIYHKGGIENKDEASMLIYDIAYSICATPDARDRFWDMSSVNFSCGLIQGLVEDAEPEEVNMKSVALMGNMIEERFAATPYMKEYFGLKPADSVAAMSASGTIGAPNDTRGGIVAVDRQAKRIFVASEGLSRMMAGTDFTYDEIAKGKTIVYLLYPGETNVYMPLVSCFVGQAYCALVRIAKEQKDLRLPKRCNFVLDEFSNLTVNEFPNRISMGRGYNMRFLLFVQDISQLQRKYSEEDMQTILSNCTTKVYYNVENYVLKQQLSNECGMTQAVTEHGVTEYHPLVAPAELGVLRFGEALVFRRGVNYPFVTRLTPSFQMNLPEYDPPAQLPTLPDTPVHTFDLRQFVKDKKRAKLFDGLESNSDPVATVAIPTQEDSLPRPRPSFDFNDLSARIDAKIARMNAEEEERQSDTAQSKRSDAAEQKSVSVLETSDSDDDADELLDEYCDEDDMDDFFTSFNARRRDAVGDAIINCVFGNDDMVDLMKIDGLWDVQQEESASRMNRIVALSFVASFEKGETELASLFQYTIQLPIYADYLEVRKTVYSIIDVNECNQQRLFDYLDSHIDGDAYAALYKRFPLTDAQKENLKRRATDLMIFDME